MIVVVHITRIFDKVLGTFSNTVRVASLPLFSYVLSTLMSLMWQIIPDSNRVVQSDLVPYFMAICFCTQSLKYYGW